MHMFDALCSILSSLQSSQQSFVFATRGPRSIQQPSLRMCISHVCMFFPICGPTIQPLTIKFGPRLAKYPRQVNINNFVQCSAIFKPIIVHNPQRVIQHGMAVKALSVICGTWLGHHTKQEPHLRCGCPHAESCRGFQERWRTYPR